jgi:hypothetical protein
MKIRGSLQLMGLAAAASVLVACPGYDQEERPRADVPVMEVGPGAPADTPQAMPLPERVPIEGRGIQAEAVLSPMQGSTHVVIEVRQGPPNQPLRASLRGGTCAAPGEAVASLGTVTVEELGTGRSEAHIDVPAQQVFEREHHIQLHPGAAEPGQMAACGDLPRRAVGQP